MRIMELYVETLTGIAFELRVSPYETIIDVKAKIQKFEGIPISQQHLLWKSIELEDEYCLIDYRITNGSTLQLVLSMRCGPINTKRVAHEECASEVSEYIDLNNKGGLLKKLPLTDKPVTYLVFRDGNKLNLYRLFRDESSTAETIVRKPVHTSRQSRKHNHGNLPDAVGENEVTMRKMETIKAQLSSRMNRNKENPRQFEFAREFANDGKKKLNSNDPSHTKKITSLLPVLRTDKDRKNNKLEGRGKTRESQVTLHTFRSNINLDSRDNVQMERKSSILVGDKPIRNVECTITSDWHEDRPNKELLLSHSKEKSRSKPSQEPCDDKRQSLVSNNPADDVIVSKVLTSDVISAKTFHSSQKLLESPRMCDSMGKIDQIGRLPDVSYSTMIQNKDATKCTICNKKLGLSNNFDCRCGRIFCSRHRYAEVHNCPFDYKSDGRKILEEKNPTITAPKLPKI